MYVCVYIYTYNFLKCITHVCVCVYVCNFHILQNLTLLGKGNLTSMKNTDFMITLLTGFSRVNEIVEEITFSIKYGFS